LILLAASIGPTGAAPPDPVRFATFNASLNRSQAGRALFDLSNPETALTPNSDFQARNVAEIIQRVQPDVLLINEFDFEPDDALADAFQANYLSESQHGADPITYPYVFSAPSNTGIPSGFDLDNNGSVGGPNDAFGFGFFPGQFGMGVFSRYPILFDQIRTFQTFLWKDMPGALLPDDPATPAAADWYSPAELAVFRLSSKSHWDVPINLNGTVVHFLVSHPTPPVFDGLEDRNGTRNHDEIRLWADYVTPGPASAYIYDDDGVFGGLKPGSFFVIAGDQNSDPVDGDSIPGSAQLLLDHPLIRSNVAPSSPGAVEQDSLQGGANLTHEGNPAHDTADFADTAPGNLRADYVLPSRQLRLIASAVFWPLMSDPNFGLVGVFTPSLLSVGGFPSSDHRLVWVDVNVPGG
jgi:hypothetical protein